MKEVVIKLRCCEYLEDEYNTEVPMSEEDTEEMIGWLESIDNVRGYMVTEMEVNDVVEEEEEKMSDMREVKVSENVLASCYNVISFDLECNKEFMEQKDVNMMESLKVHLGVLLEEEVSLEKLIEHKDKIGLLEYWDTNSEPLMDGFLRNVDGGCHDIEDLDFSYMDDNEIEFLVDSLFVVRVEYPSDLSEGERFIGVMVVRESEVEVHDMDGQMLYFDSRFVSRILEGIKNNSK